MIAIIAAKNRSSSSSARRTSQVGSTNNSRLAPTTSKQTSTQEDGSLARVCGNFGRGEVESGREQAKSSCATTSASEGATARERLASQ